MTYLKCTLAGVLAVFAATFLTVVAVMVSLFSMASHSSRTESIGWDPISLARPFTGLVALTIFLVGFFWEFYRLRSK
jgi:hypothetical protein